MKIKVTLKQSYNDIELYFPISEEEMALTLISEILKGNSSVSATLEYVEEKAND